MREKLENRIGSIILRVHKHYEKALHAKREVYIQFHGNSTCIAHTTRKATVSFGTVKIALQSSRPLPSHSLPQANAVPHYEIDSLGHVMAGNEIYRQRARSHASMVSVLAAGTPSAHAHSSPLRNNRTAPLAADPMNSSRLERLLAVRSEYLPARMVR